MGLSFLLLSKVTGLGGKALILKNRAAENSGSPMGINGLGKDLSLLVSTGKHLLLQSPQLGSGEVLPLLLTPAFSIAQGGGG